MAVTINPLKVAQQHHSNIIYQQQTHQNDVLQPNSGGSSGGGLIPGQEYFNFPLQDGSGSGAGIIPSASNPAADVLLFTINCTSEWMYTTINTSSGETIALCNDSANHTTVLAAGDKDMFGDFILMGITSVILGLMILITIIGKLCEMIW